MTTTVLLVDDDEFVRSITQEVLEQCGYGIETAEDGLESVDIYLHKGLFTNP